jgi:hypothetical protein
MLSDHLLHLKSGLKEIAVNLHTSASMLKIMRPECDCDISWNSRLEIG